MFSKIAFVASLAVLAVASSQCNENEIKCCHTVDSADTPAVSSLLKVLGVVIGDVTATVGLGCSGVSVIGSASNCNFNPVCCEGNDFHGGLISVGCSPITL